MLFDALPDAAVGDGLLRCLRDAVGTRNALAFAAPPRRMLGGFDTLIYGFELHRPPPVLEGPLILRVYRDERGPDRARYETAVHNSLAALGYPTPGVLYTCTDRSVIGGAFIIMPRVRGRVMLDAFFGPRIVRMPGLLAQVQADLHQLDTGAFAQRVGAAGVSMQRMSVTDDFAALRSRIATAQLSGLSAGVDWLMANRPPSAPAGICHGDFHPLNVMLDNGAVAGVLDWANVKVDDPAWDVGATVALMTQGPIDLPAGLRHAVRGVTRWVVAAYLRAYAARRRIDPAAVRYYEAFRSLGMLVETGEHRQAARGVVPPIAKPSAFDTRGARTRLLRRFRSITGLELSVPG